MQQIVRPSPALVATSLNELLMRDGSAFVSLAYWLIVGREASQAEVVCHGRLSGNWRKKRMLIQLARSEDSQAFETVAAPLDLALRQRALQGLPPNDATLLWRTVCAWTVRLLHRSRRPRFVAMDPQPVLSARGQHIHASLLAAFEAAERERATCTS